MVEGINLNDLPTEIRHQFVPNLSGNPECVHCGVAETPKNKDERCVAAERHWTQEGNPFKGAAERRAWEEIADRGDTVGQSN